MGKQAERSIFGTDGVRGRANQGAMTAEGAMRLAQAAAQAFARGDHKHRAVIGKDTRLSGYMLESALQAGFTSMGMDVFLLGPVPTPAVGMLTRSLRADLGVMISASHNPFEDNGIKLFGPDGFKLSDAREAEIEALMRSAPHLVEPAAIGRAQRVDGGAERYMEVVKSSFPRSLRLDGLKVVIDCANGAAYRTAPAVLWELGAEIIRVGVSPNGVNINAGCGSTDLSACRKAVLEHGADIGVSLDGDADRLLVVDETGEAVDGDQIMALIATRWAAAGRLSGGALTATVMSNLGLERHLAAKGIGLIRTRVGDRYVVESMRATGCNVGGEQSGHIVLLDVATTGDGLLAALHVLAALAESGRPASETLRLFTPLPQMLRSVRYRPGVDPLASPSVREAIAAVEAEINGRGRILIRPSGTEPVIRVMVEAEEETVVRAQTDFICAALDAVA